MDLKNLSSFSLKDITHLSVDSEVGFIIIFIRQLLTFLLPFQCEKPEDTSPQRVQNHFNAYKAMTNLRYLYLEYFYLDEVYSFHDLYRQDRSAHFEDFLEHMPVDNLQQLYLGFRHTKKEIENVSWHCMKQLPCLKELTIDSHCILSCNDFKALNIILTKCPNLKKLVLKCHFNYKDSGDCLIHSLSRLYTEHPNLPHLTLNFGVPIKKNNVVIKSLYRTWAAQWLPNGITFILKEEIGWNVFIRIYKYPSMCHAVYVQPKLRFKEYIIDSENEDKYDEDDVASNSIDEEINDDANTSDSDELTDDENTEDDDENDDDISEEESSTDDITEENDNECNESDSKRAKIDDNDSGV